jgi:hypothetical protein
MHKQEKTLLATEPTKPTEKESLWALRAPWPVQGEYT